MTRPGIQSTVILHVYPNQFVFNLYSSRIFTAFQLVGLILPVIVHFPASALAQSAKRLVSAAKHLN